MNKGISIAILIVGIVLLAFGFNAAGSLASETKEVFTGTPTDKSMILIVLGIIGVIVGGLGALFRRGTR
jgi:divalent metal cation (Fe/Co/Zn/Cd) transporter